MNSPRRIDDDGTGSIGGRIASVRERISNAALRAGRDPSDVKLVVVTKEVPVGAVAEALAAGATDLGENRVQELTGKMEALAAYAPPPRWHLIGTLQRNKVKDVVGEVAMIHSIDSIALGLAVGSRAASVGCVQDALLEVNVSGETAKHGFDASEAAEALEALAGAPGLRIRGLMTIAPLGAAAVARRCFAALRDLRDELRSTLAGTGMDELSMGMTRDFAEAISEGATIVRIGTAIFGPRSR